VAAGEILTSRHAAYRTRSRVGRWSSWDGDGRIAIIAAFQRLQCGCKVNARQNSSVAEYKGLSREDGPARSVGRSSILAATVGLVLHVGPSGHRRRRSMSRSTHCLQWTSN